MTLAGKRKVVAIIDVAAVVTYEKIMHTNLNKIRSGWIVNLAFVCAV